MNYIFEFLISYLATLAFAYYFNCPKKSLFYTSLLGGTSWVVYSIMRNLQISYILSGVTSAFVIGLSSEFFARKLKMPATIFLIPGLVPLVPGAGMYYTMYYLIQQQYDSFQDKAIETLFLAGSLAAGVVVSSSIFKIISFYQQKNR
ncbi:MAG: threonine/serine exporter family protein [Peptoniphilus sp.]|uniref:threonine/serine exporter family protein n=1 Tax=Peptoniphilus sp. TaxID=1971214 RepID=UPI002A75B21F|nr:threonine/serine exporter family protein [Peptoniphilus sp.]MDY2986477.1 threonine/serine exporter family protein [Peptoniphilus sp.]